jgi:hypothetical protein
MRWMRTTFRRTFFAVLAVLVVLVAGFAALDRAQGPKLSSELVDPVAVATRPAQTLQLSVNERVAPVKRSQVTVTPTTSFAVLASAQQVVLQFPEPLDYSTTYRVVIARVTSADDGVSSTLRYSFHTTQPMVYYLRRSHGSGPDQILLTSPGSTSQTSVYSAQRIQDFAVLNGTLAVVTLDLRGDSSLVVVSRAGVVRRIALPGTGVIGVIRADVDTGTFGFTFTSSGATGGYVQDLFTLGVSGPGRPTVVKGLGGKPLAALNWYYVPGAGEMVALGSDGNAELVNPTDPTATVPFASYFTLNSVATDGRSASVSDITGALSIALPAGKTVRVTPSRLDGETTIGGAAQRIPGGWLQIDSIYDAGIGAFTEHLVFDNGTTARALYTPPNPRGSIDGFQDSPGNQYVTIETTPDVATAKPDGYRFNGRSTSVSTLIVDLKTGRVLNTLNGFDAQW